MTKKELKLTKEEKKIHSDVLSGKYKSVSNLEQMKKQIIKVAENTLSKNKTITVRISERNLNRLKASAAKEGLPYQTLVTSLIQKHI